MLKNKPWQIRALLAIHSVTLVYVIYELTRRIILYPSAGTSYAATAVSGVAALLFLVRGSLTGLVLEIIYLFSLFYCGVHYADILVVTLLIAVFALQKPSREYFKAGGRINIKRTVIISAVTIMAAVLSAVFLYNIDGIFYITHSKQNLNRITEYITETYGNSTEINESSYKQLGYVYVTTDSGEFGSVSIVNGIIADKIVIDKLREKYEEKINEGLESQKYYINIYPSYEASGKPQADIRIIDFNSETKIYSQSSINRVYQMFLELIKDGYEVSVTHGYRFDFMGVSLVENKSLLLPFLNKEALTFDMPPPTSVEFTQKCSAAEFTERINENIRATRAYRDTHPNNNTYSGSSYRRNRILYISMAVMLALTLPFYIMQAVALSEMTKRRGLSKPWLAWIPHISQYSLAKISDDTDAYHGCGKTLAKRTLIIFAIEGAAIFIQAVAGEQDPIASLIGAAVSIAVTITLFQSVFRVYDAYSPQNATSRKVLSFFFASFAIPIILFTIRNNSPAGNITAASDNDDIEGR